MASIVHWRLSFVGVRGKQGLLKSICFCTAFESQRLHLLPPAGLLPRCIRMADFGVQLFWCSAPWLFGTLKQDYFALDNYTGLSGIPVREVPAHLSSSQFRSIWQIRANMHVPFPKLPVAISISRWPYCSGFTVYTWYPAHNFIPATSFFNSVGEILPPSFYSPCNRGGAYANSMLFTNYQDDWDIARNRTTSWSPY